MSQRTREALEALIAVVRDETVPGANTRTRVASLLQDVVDSLALIDHGHDAATVEVDGFLSAADKLVLDAAITHAVEGANIALEWSEDGRTVTISAVNAVSVSTYASGSGTWIKPAGCAWVQVTVVGGGQGGHRNAYSGTGTSYGGGGGGSGSVVQHTFLAADLPSTVAYSVGAGGAGATANDSFGSDGGASSFGSLLAPGGRQISVNAESNGGAGYCGGGHGSHKLDDETDAGQGTFSYGKGRSGGGGGAGRTGPHESSTGAPFYMGGGAAGGADAVVSGARAQGGAGGCGYGAGGGGGGGNGAANNAHYGGGGGGQGWCLTPALNSPVGNAGQAASTGVSGNGGDGLAGLVRVVTW